MTDRITHETVTFAHPFELADVDGKQPAGTYTIETVEESIDSLSFVAYRRVSTTIALTCQKYGGAATQLVTIDPSNLEAARKRDAELG